MVCRYPLGPGSDTYSTFHARRVQTPRCCRRKRASAVGQRHPKPWPPPTCLAGSPERLHRRWPQCPPEQDGRDLQLALGDEVTTIVDKRLRVRLAPCAGLIGLLR